MRTCDYCKTEYEVPVGVTPRVERTADIPPPARVCVWGPPSEVAREFPRGWDWSNPPPILHACRKGRACAPEDLWT